MQIVALLKCLAALCHVSSVKLLGLRMCKCESLKAKLPFEIITVPSAKVLSNKISLSSLHFNSCTTTMLCVSEGLPLKILVRLTNPNAFTTFLFSKGAITTLIWSFLRSSKDEVYSTRGCKTIALWVDSDFFKDGGGLGVSWFCTVI